MRIITTLLLVCLTFSCAHPNFTASIEKFGELGSIQNQIKEPVNHLNADDVKVFIGQMPPGIDLDGPNIRIQPSSGHKVLGILNARHLEQSFWAWGWYDYVEEEKWKSWFCPIQNVLLYATLLQWFLVPGPVHVCIISISSNDSKEISMRRKYIIKSMQKAAKNAGGNAVVMTSIGNLQTFDRNTSRLLSTTEMTGAAGYVIQLSGTEYVPNKKPESI